MKNWNTVGYIKAGVLLLVAFPNFFLPPSALPQQPILVVVFAFFAPFIVLALKAFKRFKEIREMGFPSWNENPFTSKKWLTKWVMGSGFFLTQGTALLIGSLIRFSTPPMIVFAILGYGFGILVGSTLPFYILKQPSSRP